jgi:hypothetical protein
VAHEDTEFNGDCMLLMITLTYQNIFSQILAIVYIVEIVQKQFNAENFLRYICNRAAKVLIVEVSV